MAKYDYLIVGSGLFGSVFARQATDAGKKVLVIDKRPHIGGNCYTEQQHGIHVHKYGPHIFHTSNEDVWKYVNRFAQFNHFTNRVKVNYRGRLYSFPINLMTFHQLWGVTTPAEAEERLKQERCLTLGGSRNLEDWCLSQVGPEVYEKFIKGYTEKQWMRKASELPASIIRRLPIRLTYDDNYYNDKYQGIPIGGYTAMFERLLDGVEVKLGVDFKDEKPTWRNLADRLVYTGPVDEFFDYNWGQLQYRTLEFKEELHDGDYQGVAQMNFTSPDVPWTRIIEHKHFEFGTQAKTVITREYPVAWEPGKTPYYPVNDDFNQDIYKLYRSEAENQYHVIFGGRLGTFKYLDMHQVIGQALAVARNELED